MNSSTRREFLGLAAVTTAGVALSVHELSTRSWTRLWNGSPASYAAPPVGAQTATAVHLLNRIAFGPRPGEVAEVLRGGCAAYIDQQLDPEDIVEPLMLTWRLRRLGDLLNPDAGLLFDEDDRRLVEALRAATTLRAVYSRRQLYERMVEFWSDHFNIYAFKGEGAQLKIIDDHDTLRAHALGSFRDLLFASARSAAMLGYLDNASNRRGVANENYAREVMELHTLGVDGGYTQTDVKELARCLTGWTSARHWHRGRFQFDSSAHDDGAKHVLGLVPGGGVQDAEQVLEFLAVHPATARHIARKLCTYFIGSDPESVVDLASKVFLRTKGEIKPVVRAILTSPDFAVSALSGGIVKRPFDYTVSALRALDADTDGGQTIQEHLAAMGQPLFGWPMPNGYPTGSIAAGQGQFWLGGLIPRWRFAAALAGGGITNTSVAALNRCRDSGDVAERVFSRHRGDLLPVLRLIPQSASTAEYAALLIASPAFQWR